MLHELVEVVEVAEVLLRPRLRPPQRQLRVQRPVEPGDQLVMECTAERSRGGIYKFHAVARVDGELACEADLMCTVRRIEA